MRAAGAINPWDAFGTLFTEIDLCWDVEEFRTPFAAFTYLIQNWPGPTQTSEQTETIRHQRLVETIAGYPEIASGRRPLDMPLHKKSVIAFKLTNFLDRIPGPEELEWHSLKTALLHYDLRQHGKQMNYEKFFHHMMAKIRENTTYIDNDNKKKKYQPNNLHPDEIEFITVLHSQNHESSKYWPDFVNEDKKLNFQTMGNAFKDPTKINVSNKRNNFTAHEFKFKKIQTWIKEWTECAFIENPWLSKDASQHLIVGASVMLESVLAKMRSYILKEKRPGALIVDGGGRLRYLSKNSPEKEANWFEEKIERIFLFDPEHLHPYQERISIVLETYIQHISDQLKSCHPFEMHFFNAFRKPASGPSAKLSAEGYEILIGREPTRQFLPEISKGEGQPSEDDSVVYDSLITRNDVNTPLEFESCVLCSLQSRPKKENEKSSVNEIIRSGQFVCAFHTLLHAIGKESKIRLQSQPDLFKRPSRRLFHSEKGVQKMLVFDGNAIGQLFNQPFNKWLVPSDSNISSSVWTKNKDNIMDVYHEWDIHKIDDSTQWKALLCRRMQPMLRIQRRSFSFNANWWLSLQKAMKEAQDASMVPWIMAGDDIVMVNHLDVDDKNIRTMLLKFQENLQTFFPANVPITFAGALHDRENLTIIDLYKQARELEEFAGHLWKWHANSLKTNGGDDWNLLHKNKLKKLHDWVTADQSRNKQCEMLMKQLKTKQFTFQTSDLGYTSLIVPNDLFSQAFPTHDNKTPSH